MASRSADDLHEPLRERWEWMRDEWRKRHPEGPQPFLTATYRTKEEQADLYAKGRSNALPGESLHNFLPAFAFDVAFDPDLTDGIGNDVTWLFPWYQRWGELAEDIGLQWGGRFPGLIDGPHVQMPMTWQEARDGKVPELPSLAAPDAKDEKEWMLLLLYHGKVEASLTLKEGDAIVTRVDPASRRQWIDVKGKE